MAALEVDMEVAMEVAMEAAMEAMEVMDMVHGAGTETF